MGNIHVKLFKEPVVSGSGEDVVSRKSLRTKTDHNSSL